MLGCGIKLWIECQACRRDGTAKIKPHLCQSWGEAHAHRHRDLLISSTSLSQKSLAATSSLFPPSSRVSDAPALEHGDYFTTQTKLFYCAPPPPPLTCESPSLRLSSQSALLGLCGFCLRALFGGGAAAADTVFKCGLAMHPKLPWDPQLCLSGLLFSFTNGGIISPPSLPFLVGIF